MSTEGDNTVGRPGPLTRLTEQDRLWQETVRSFAETHVRPHVARMDAEATPDAGLLEAMFAAKLMGIEVPAVYGGASGSLFHVVLAIEEIARVCPGIAVYADVQNALVNSSLLRWGTGDQKRRFLPRLATNMIGAYALSEKEAGSDAFAMATTAEQVGNEFIINGRKHWTSCGAEAGLFVLFARTGQEGANRVTAFLVERSTPGLGIGKKVDKLGIRANSTCDLVLENVRVRRENILGQLGDGNTLAAESLNIGRIGIAAQMLGLAQGAFEAALAYAQKRKQFGQRIASFQGVQFSLAEMTTEIEASRLLVYNAAHLFEQGATTLERFRTAAMAKYYASVVAERVASLAVEIFGGNGFTKEFPVEKFYRDAKIGKIYEGTSNMLLRTIASTLLQGAHQEGNAHGELLPDQ